MAEDIVSRLVAKVDGFLRGFDQAERKVKDFSTKGQRDIQTFQGQIQSLSRVIQTVFVTGAVARMIQKTVEFGDGLDKNSRRLGLAVKDLAALEFAADRAGVSQEGLARGIAQAQKNLLDFSRGTGEARLELQALGVDQAQALALLKNPMEAFLTVGEAVNRSTNKTATAMKLFGESGRELIPLFQGGREDLDQLNKKFQDAAGDVERLAASSAAFKDQLTDVGAAVTGLQTRGLNPVIPALERLFQQFEDFLNSPVARGIVEFLGTVTGLTIDLTTAIGTLIGGGAAALTQALTGNFDGARAVLEQMKADMLALREGIVNGKPIAAPAAIDAPVAHAVAQTESKRLANLIAVKQATIELLKLDDAHAEAVQFQAFTLEKEVAALKEALALEKEREAAAKAGTAEDPQVKRLAALEKEITLKKILKDEERAIGEIQAQVGTELQSQFAEQGRAQQRPDRAQLAREELELTILQKREAADIGDVHAAQLQVFDRQLQLLRERLAIEGELKEITEAIALKEAERANLLEQARGKDQVALGRTIVANATGDLQAAFRPLDERLRRAQTALAVGDLRHDRFGEPLQLPGTRLLRRIDIAAAERDRLALQFQQTGNPDVGAALEVKTAEVEDLQKAFESLDFKNLKTEIESFGQAFSSAINTTVQGVLLGTQTIDQAWKNLLRNIALQVLNQATQKLIGNAISGLAGFFAGGAATGGVLTMNGFMPLQRFATGGIATRPTLAVFGEGAQNEAFVPLPDGRRIPVVMNGGGQAPQVIIYNYSGQPVETEEERTPGGGGKVHVTVGRLGAENVMRQGELYKAIQTKFGLSPVAGRR